MGEVKRYAWSSKDAGAVEIAGGAFVSWSDYERVKQFAQDESDGRADDCAAHAKYCTSVGFEREMRIAERDNLAIALRCVLDHEQVMMGLPSYVVNGARAMLAAVAATKEKGA